MIFSNDVDATVDTPWGILCLAAMRANIKSAPGADRLHMPMGEMPKGRAASWSNTARASERSRTFTKMRG